MSAHLSLIKHRPVSKFVWIYGSSHRRRHGPVLLLTKCSGDAGAPSAHDDWLLSSAAPAIVIVIIMMMTTMLRQ